jgi:hypothetical protein
MLHIFIIPACSLLVNLQTLNNKASYNFTRNETSGLFNGRIYAINIRPESVVLN